MAQESQAQVTKETKSKRAKNYTRDKQTNKKTPKRTKKSQRIEARQIFYKSGTRVETPKRAKNSHGKARAKYQNFTKKSDE